ncbi:MAG: cation:proton antiporter, partial [Halieaceae bacterium]
AGRLLGGFLVAMPGAKTYRWIGLAMLPQAGVAMAMAFQAVSLYPELQDSLLPLVIAATVVFELVGPVATRMLLMRVPENS